jgi:hypothetical protein
LNHLSGTVSPRFLHTKNLSKFAGLAIELDAELKINGESSREPIELVRSKTEAETKTGKVAGPNICSGPSLRNGAFSFKMRVARMFQPHHYIEVCRSVVTLYYSEFV